MAPKKTRIIDFDVEIGRRVRAERRNHGIAQSEFADALDLSFQQLQKYEQGTNRISAGRLLQMANLLNIPVAQFFEGLEDAHKPANSAAREAGAEYQRLLNFASGREGQKLFRAFDKLDAQGRRAVLRMMEALAASGD
jgi:transcriptional regulator with XRE-family HTH domain